MRRLIKGLSKKNIFKQGRLNMSGRMIAGIVQRGFSAQKPESYEFKAETKKLLDIVAKSLYTDSHVFIRELLSNGSDALEKQRFMQLSNADTEIGEQLQIMINCDEKQKMITIQDTGIGMNKEDLMNNLGTIASSGSKKFMEQMKNSENSVADNIIGQFGVGFYSAFIVGNTVEVFSQKSKGSGGDGCWKWVSDGAGVYDIQQVAENDDGYITRGTSIRVHLRSEMLQFSKAETIKNIINKYSNFINHSIYLNGEHLNLVGALWMKDKREITNEQYNEFYQYYTNQKVNYKYKLHYSADVPLMIKALLYVGATHSEKFGMVQEEFQVSLYSRKILIKQNCRELLPNWMRFVKGVVDCEDIPLNISRENFQDTHLMNKLKGLLTKRVLKMLDEEASKNESKYLDWYRDFQFFLKEGLATDQQYQDQIMKLCRYQHNQSDEYISLDEYIDKLKDGSDKIYFLLAQNREAAENSPYYEPFKNTDIPIIFINMHVDEMVFQGVGTYKSKYSFVNIETNYDDVSKELEKHQKKDTANVDQQSQDRLVEDDIPAFSLWLKKELEPIVNKVQVSSRLKESPALIQGQMSSGMRQVMQMMEAQDKSFSMASQMNNNLTLEINPSHKLIKGLNDLRKTDMQLASSLAKQMLDNTMLNAGILDDQKGYVTRVNKLMLSLLQSKLDNPQQQEQPMQRESILEDIQEEPSHHDQFNEEIIVDEKGNPHVVNKKK